jgi:hypothetical protein
MPCIFSQILLIENYVAGFKRRYKILKKTALFLLLDWLHPNSQLKKTQWLPLFLFDSTLCDRYELGHLFWQRGRGKKPVPMTAVKCKYNIV